MIHCIQLLLHGLMQPQHAGIVTTVGPDRTNLIEYFLSWAEWLWTCDTVVGPVTVTGAWTSPCRPLLITWDLWPCPCLIFVFCSCCLSHCEHRGGVVLKRVEPRLAVLEETKTITIQHWPVNQYFGCFFEGLRVIIQWGMSIWWFLTHFKLNYFWKKILPKCWV